MDTIIGSLGNDILQSAGNTMLFGLDGNDIILATGSDNSLFGGAGNDYFDAAQLYNSLLDGGIGDDRIIPSDVTANGGSNILVLGGDGDDVINNIFSESIVDAGNGNDVIYNNQVVAIIDAGDGNDIIRNNSAGEYSSIIGGTGHDSILNYAHHTIIEGNDGADVIFNVGASDVFISGDKDNDFIQNDHSYVYIDAGAGNDIIRNSTTGNYSSLVGGTGADTILNYAYYSTLQGNAGSDYIINFGADDVYVFGGAGDDIITEMVAGAHYGVSIAGGTGNDLINLEGGEETVIYNLGDGNDTIVGFNEYTYISGDFDDYSLEQNGNNVIMHFDGGSMTLVDVVITEDGSNQLSAILDNNNTDPLEEIISVGNVDNSTAIDDHVNYQSAFQPFLNAAADKVTSAKRRHS